MRIFHLVIPLSALTLASVQAWPASDVGTPAEIDVSTCVYVTRPASDGSQKNEGDVSKGTLNDPSKRGMSFCFATVRCQIKGTRVETLAKAMCKANNDGSCPKSDECAVDRTVSVDFTPQVRSKKDVPENNTLAPSTRGGGQPATQ